MIRIAHTGDLHVTEGPRLDDARKALAFIASDAADRCVDLFLIGGDMAGHASPHRATPAERLVLADFLQECAGRAPVVVLRGNHDVAEDLEIYGRLSAAHPIHVVNYPTVLEVAGARVYCLPYPSKAWAMAAGAVGGDLTEQKAGVETNLRALLSAWRLDAEDCRARGVPTVGLFHLNVGGSVVGGGEVLIGREVELAPHDLNELGFDAGCLSHIHKAQRMAERWHYAGSPFAQNHGEAKDPKAYDVLEIGVGIYDRIQVPTPSRRLVTVRLEWVFRDGDWMMAIPSEVPPPLADADVRLIVQVPEDGVESCPFERFAEAMLVEGAHSVKLERRILPKTRVRSEAITTAVTLEEQLAAYFDSLESPPDAAQREGALEKLGELHVEERKEDIAA